jgi:hypothetical protein
VTTSTIRTTAPGRPRGSHPAWCTQQSPDCNGTSHHSPDIAVPEDQCAGEGVRAALWGEERLYIALMFTPVRDNADVRTVARLIAEGETEQSPLAEAPAIADDAPRRISFQQHPDDPVYVEEPHAHDLTVAQAEVLHQALGYLLSLAGSRAAA